MNERLKRLQELRKAAAEKIAELKESRTAITDKVEAEERGDLTEEETSEFRTLTADIKAEQERFDDLDGQVRELESEMERSGRLDERAKSISKGTVVVTEVKEPLTYQYGNGNSYFRDLAHLSVNMADEGVKERLERHRIDVATDKDIKRVAKVGNEYRNLDRNDGTGGVAVPPLWLMNQFIELARAGSAYANLVPTQALPAGTDSINIPKISSGTSTAIQTADNASISETNAADTSVQANVKTIAGAQGMSIQLLQQSPINFDELIFRDLAADYATKKDIQVISGSGSGNQVVGVRNTAGIGTVTVNSAGSNGKVATVYAALSNAINQVHTVRFMAPEVIVMHPRRWAWFLAAADTTGRPLVVPVPGQINAIGSFGGVVSQTTVGSMLGLPVVTDPSIPTNLGAGTNQDVIHVLRNSDLVLFESSVRARALQETRAETLTVLLQVFGFLAFSAGRYPASVVEVGGSLLSAPLFDGSNG